MHRRKYRIDIHGCDDSTCFDFDLTYEEYQTLLEICEKSKEVSTYGCMPTIDVKLNENDVDQKDGE